MSIGQTYQTNIRVLIRPNRPNYGYWVDPTDRNLEIGQTDQTEYGHWTDRTDRNMCIGRTD